MLSWLLFVAAIALLGGILAILRDRPLAAIALALLGWICLAWALR